MFTKNTFLWFLDFLGEKLILDYVLNTKSQILHEKNFLAKNLCLSTKASLQPKKGLKIFFLKFVFLLMKKCISYKFHIWKMYDELFLTKIKIMFLLSLKIQSWK